MRSDTIKRGDARAAHRSLLRATGVGEGDWNKPFIAICNSHVDIIPGHVHLQAVGNYVKECVRAAGGVPFLFNTIGVDDGIAMGHDGMKFSLPSRELIADCVETMIQAHCFDAMVCIPNCDKIVPGMFMGAMRVNIPTIFVSGGPMEAGRTASGTTVDLIDAFVGGVQKQNGKISAEELEEIEKAACPTCGSCSGMFTANSMNCLAEAIGLALPGNGTILATSADRKALYERAAKRIVAMARDFAKKGPGHGILAREIASPAAFDNAMILDMAMGGSTNTVLHILAIAHEAGVPFSLERIDALSKKTPNLCKVSPSSRYHIEDVARAGGIHTILGEVARGCPGALDALVHDGHWSHPGREYRRIRRPRNECRCRRPIAHPSPCRRRAHQPGLDRPERLGRNAVRKSPASPCSTPKERALTTNPAAPGDRIRRIKRSRGRFFATRGRCRRWFQPVRRYPHRRECVLRDRWPLDAQGQPRPSRSGRQNGRRQLQNAQAQWASRNL